MSRLKTYLAVTFLITWICWWTLVLLVRPGMTVYGHPLFVLLFALGGLGPTIAAYAAVLATPNQSPLREFNLRLLRWRVVWWWYVIALVLPFALALAPLGLAALIDPGLPASLVLRPWYMFFPLFLVMILGGGLEELGWRGVAQPEMEQGIGRPAAAVLVGLIWSLWHLPLFFLPGQLQYRTNFPVFVVSVVGSALILAWLYGRTQSILLCILFHAGLNTVAALGLALPSGRSGPALLEACFKLLIGALLLFVFPSVCDKSLQPKPSSGTLGRQG
ncbi:MAG: type II CAAX endopeptidase family protein [Terracidiphilus sp.]|jgi:membrane protease YdiL (CAAX protease family)